MNKFKRGDHPSSVFINCYLQNLEMQESDVVDYLFEKSLEKYEKFKLNKVRVDDKLAYKLSVLTNTSIDFWQNLQKEFDSRA